MVEDPRVRLARLIRERRQELQISAGEAARRAGLSRNTWAAAEDGSRQTWKRNHSGIEHALNWLPGSVERVLDGGDPFVRTTNATVSRPVPAIDLEYELGRVDQLDVPARTKLLIVAKLLELYEEAQAEDRLAG